MDYQLNRMFSELKNNCETYDQAVAFNDLLATFSDEDDDADDVEEAGKKADEVAAATGSDPDDVRDAAVAAADAVAKADVDDADEETGGTLTASDAESVYVNSFSDAYVAACNIMYSDVCYGNRSFSSVCDNMVRTFADAAEENKPGWVSRHYDMAKKHVKKNRGSYIGGAGSAIVGATSGALIGDALAKKHGWSKKKSRIIGGLIGAAAAGTGGGFIGHHIDKKHADTYYKD
jgi:hypothetical protein